MENLNAERTKRGLECCKGSYDCFTCDIYKRGCAGFREGLAKDALALIQSYEGTIFALENRLKECENGYEGSLHLDRCRLHDAEEKIKELSTERDGLKNHNDYLKALVDNAFVEKIKGFDEPSAVRACAEAEFWRRNALYIKELTEENERVRAENKMVAKRTVRKFVKMLKSQGCRCDSCINEIKKEIENEN